MSVIRCAVKVSRYYFRVGAAGVHRVHVAVGAAGDSRSLTTTCADRSDPPKLLYTIVTESHYINRQTILSKYTIYSGGFSSF